MNPCWNSQPKEEPNKACLLDREEENGVQSGRHRHFEPHHGIPPCP